MEADPRDIALNRAGRPPLPRQPAPTEDRNPRRADMVADLEPKVALAQSGGFIVREARQVRGFSGVKPAGGAIFPGSSCARERRQGPPCASRMGMLCGRAPFYPGQVFGTESM